MALLFLAICCPTAGLAQQCSNNISATTPTARFKVARDIAVDRDSELIWRRCSEGQIWHQDMCQGEVTQLTWAEAQTYLKQHTDWRLPTLKELAGLVELSCSHPAINLQLFPNSASNHYWSATRFASSPEMHWQVQFATGDSHNAKGSAPAALRLIRESKKPSSKLKKAKVNSEQGENQ